MVGCKTLKDPTSATTTFAYDSLNRLTSTTDALSHVSKTAYDPEGNVLSRTDANGNTSTYVYDEDGRLVSTTDALGNVSSQGYCADVSGSPCQSVDPDGNVTTRQLDSMGRVTTLTDGASDSTVSTYTSGQLQKVTDPRGNATTYSYSYNRLGTVSGPLSSTSYTYDARGNRATVTFAGGVTTYTYDANNRLLTEKNPLNITTTYAYNLDGTRHTKVDGNGHTTTYGYDANKRLTSVTFADLTSYSFTYDSRGHRLTETSPSVTRTLTYDTVGRLATAQDGLTTKTITYGYDAVGNRTSIIYDGLTTGYAYDADHRLTALMDPTGEVTSLVYDPAGNRSQLVQGNGVVTTTTYDQANRIAQITSPIQSFGYAYDLAGNPYTKTYADKTSEQYGYDASNELTGDLRRDGTNQTYSYSYGNISARAAGGVQYNATVNTFNQTTLLSGGGSSYTYTFDNDGNRLTQAYQPPGYPLPPVQNTTYTWTDDDRMSGVTLPSSATNAYGYDANGIRVSKRDSSGNVDYLIDPQTQSILATYDAVAGTRLATYNQNPQKIDEVLSYQVGAVKYYPHVDMLGSVYAVSNSSAVKQATWTYDVYGTRTQASGTLSYPFGFTGREHDVDTGLIYSRARYYDPVVGQWLQPDRLGMPNGPNRYEYVLDAPTKGSDPRGTITLMLAGEPSASDIFEWWSEAQVQGIGSTLSSYADSVADIMLTGSNGVSQWGDSYAQANAPKVGVAGASWPYARSAANSCEVSWFIALFPAHSLVQDAIGEGDTGGGFFVHELRHVIDDSTGRFVYPSGTEGEARALATEVLFNEQVSGDYMDGDFLYEIYADPVLGPAVETILQDQAQRQLLMVQ